MKKIMVLGVREAEHPFAAAARAESYEIVTGCQEADARHAPATERVMIDADDLDGATLAASRHGVSGIVGVGEKAALTAAYVARQLELPGVPYAEERLLHNLLLLRQFQEAHHFKVPRWRDLSQTQDVTGLSFPLYVSPADGNVLRHMQVVHNRSGLREARRDALRQSPGGFVIAQESPFGDRPPADAALVCTLLVIRRGELMPIVWSSCHMRRREHVPASIRYPAGIGRNARILLNGECQRLVELLSIRNAHIPVLAYSVPGSRPFLLHLGIRDDSYRMAWFWSWLYGRDLQRDALRMAAGDPAEGGRYEEPPEDTCLACYNIRTAKRGILRHLGYHESLRPYIEAHYDMERQSAAVDGSVGPRHHIGSILLRFPNAGVMEEVLERIESLIEPSIEAFMGGAEQSV